ncbi:response regulator [Morganella morganii]|uniref:response regulator n=1 Tax=Morganella morganii TaxID=582 RepID=UPI000668A001|nr:response regulator [Morganella morganii]
MCNKKILIAEDEKPKKDHVSKFLTDNFYADHLYSSSVNSTIIVIEDEEPDFIILDMSLPTFDLSDRANGGRPQGFGGKAVLRHMKLARIKIPVIILTGYEVFKLDEGNKLVSEHMDLAQFKEELIFLFHDNFIDIIHFSSTNNNWQKSLYSMLKIYIPEVIK